MLEASLPPDEEQRLAVLFNLNILDTPPEQRFDRITRMAARLFNVPIALVTLIDGERQWFKSRVGMALSETPRRIAFCAHTLLQDGVMVVEDAADDARFSDNPLVQEQPNVRFYAGHAFAAPDGSKLGTLCLIDRAPRDFSDDERTTLRDLACMVAHEVAASELQRHLREQRANEAWLRSLLDNAPDGVMMLDQDGVILSLNPAAEALFGATSAQLQGRRARSLLVETIDGIRDALAAGQTVTIESTGRAPDGSTFPIEFSVRAMRLDGKLRYAAIVRDVGQRRAAEDALRAREARRNQYLATATHELRTPMASVLGFSELLMKREFDQATGQELIGIIHDQASVLIAVTNQLLDLARIESGGKAGLRIGIHQVAALVGQVLDLPALQGNRARVTVDIDSSVPPLAVDPQRFQLALANLLSNALAYSDAGTQVVVNAVPVIYRGMPGVQIRVSDQGIGMSTEQLVRMYDPFYRAKAKPEVVGSGLGMAIFREIAELHNAAVEVDSAPGCGTVITMTLPAAQEVGDA
ncbi:ATP-binding protein [Massilia sp. S19_KUP03_FR1]|uniref:ATP-binding protein n=1 Tax=Massilia sp. S19_KUP03_FR1 TaxID=3025503 RepID=UPI002FCDA87C